MEADDVFDFERREVGDGFGGFLWWHVSAADRRTVGVDDLS